MCTYINIVILVTSDVVMICLCRNSRHWKLEGSPVTVSGSPPFQLNMQEGPQLGAAVSIADVLYTVPRLQQLLDKSQLHLKRAILNGTSLTLTATSSGTCRLCNAATHFHQVKWPLMGTFRAHNNGLECDDIRSLVQCFNWQCLKTLELSECTLDSEAVKRIAMGKWPLLEYLGLGGCCDDVETKDMQRLTSAERPLLKHLRIGVLGPEESNESVRLLACGPWSLHSLSLSVNITSLRFLLKNCQLLEDEIELDDPDPHFDVYSHGEVSLEKFVDCPGLQARPWPFMTALKVAFVHGNYMVSFAVNIDESRTSARANAIFHVRENLEINWPFYSAADSNPF